ncbi:MAG: hypothetical protein V2A77_01805 [Pseudomonadota bacterium]
MHTFKKVALLLGVGAAVLGLMLWLSWTGERVSETPARVLEFGQGQGGLWRLPSDVVAVAAGKPYVVRLNGQLQAEMVNIDVADSTAEGWQLRSAVLKPGDLLVTRPEKYTAGEAVAPVAGADETRLVRAALEAGSAAVASEGLSQCVRFISPGYKDGCGYNIALLRQLLKRAFKEFDHPQLQFVGPSVIRVRGREAKVAADVRLSVLYRGRRGYLLGDDTAANHVLVQLNKAAYGWKLSRIDGLRPLGLAERSFRLIGGEVGMPLMDTERQEKEAIRAQCRERMNVRFGVSTSR